MQFSRYAPAFLISRVPSSFRVPLVRFFSRSSEVFGELRHLMKCLCRACVSNISVPSQIGLGECGLDALWIVADHYGMTPQRRTARELIGYPVSGLNLGQVLLCARHCGFEAYALYARSGQVRSLPLPAVTLTQDAHFVVVEAWFANWVLICDPAKGRFLVSAKHLEELWRGVVIACVPARGVKTSSSFEQVGLSNLLFQSGAYAVAACGFVAALVIFRSLPSISGAPSPELRAGIFAGLLLALLATAWLRRISRRFFGRIIAEWMSLLKSAPAALVGSRSDDFGARLAEDLKSLGAQGPAELYLLACTGASIGIIVHIATISVSCSVSLALAQLLGFGGAAASLAGFRGGAANNAGHFASLEIVTLSRRSDSLLASGLWTRAVSRAFRVVTQASREGVQLRLFRNGVLTLNEHNAFIALLMVSAALALTNPSEVFQTATAVLAAAVSMTIGRYGLHGISHIRDILSLISQMKSECAVHYDPERFMSSPDAACNSSDAAQNVPRYRVEERDSGDLLFELEDPLCATFLFRSMSSRRIVARSLLGLSHDGPYLIRQGNAYDQQGSRRPARVLGVLEGSVPCGKTVSDALGLSRGASAFASAIEVCELLGITQWVEMLPMRGGTTVAALQRDFVEECALLALAEVLVQRPDVVVVDALLDALCPQRKRRIIDGILARGASVLVLSSHTAGSPPYGMAFSIPAESRSLVGATSS